MKRNRNRLLHTDADVDPMSTVANLFDVAMVFAVALMVALVARFNMSEIGNPKRVIEGIEILCIELPKFKPEDYAQRKMLKLWQEFLTSINAKTGKEEITDELLENTEVKEALDLCLDLTEEERGYYDGFWGMEFLRNDRDKTVREMSLAEGEAKGLEKGRAEGEKQANLATARKMRSKGYHAEIIAELTGLTESEIYNLN